MEYVAIDLEATSPKWQRARIVSYAFILLDENLEEQRVIKGLINPGSSIPPESTAIHGITDDMVEDAPRFPEIANRLKDVLRDRGIIAYNAQYDVNLLRREFSDADLGEVIRFDAPIFDPLRIEQHVQRRRLHDTAQRYGVPVGDAHDAEQDARATIQVLQAQRHQHADLPQAGLLSAIDEAWQQDPPGWHQRFIDPENRIFYYEEDQVLRFNLVSRYGEPLQYADNLLWLKNLVSLPKTLAIIDELQGYLEQGFAPSTWLERLQTTFPDTGAVSPPVKTLDSMRFFREEQGIVLYNQGKHAGSPVDIDREYLKGIIHNRSLAKDTREVATRLLREADSGFQTANKVSMR